MDINLLGIYGPQIMMVASLPFLWTRKMLLNYTLVGISFSIILNNIMKIIFQSKRPWMSNAQYILAKKENLWYWIENDPFGFPSGHSQSSVFITAMMYNAVGLKPITLLFMLYTFFIMWQRVYSDKHTLIQVIAGAITGMILAMCVFYAYKRGLAGYIIHKLDDCSKIRM
jgi:membrane-associated phospholipid phosphatase